MSRHRTQYTTLSKFLSIMNAIEFMIDITSIYCRITFNILNILYKTITFRFKIILKIYH